MTRATDLTPLLKRLQLGPMAATLPERIALARREQLDYASFLEIILSDEVNRRAHRRIEMRLQQARLSKDLPLGGLRLVGVNHPGPSVAGRCLLPGFLTRQWATPPYVPHTSCASSMPTITSGS